MGFPIHVPGGGGGITQLTGGVVAGPGSGSVAATTVSLTKTVDCTSAGVSKSQVSITAFDGTYATVSGLGATGALEPGYESTNIGPTFFGPGLGGGTFSGTTAFISAFDGVQTVTITGLNSMFPGMVGTNLTLSGANSGGNNGSFPISAYISNTSVEITNSAGVFPDTNSGSISWTITINTTANITAFTTPLATVTGLSGITPSMVGKYVAFTGFANSANNSTFQIAAFISSTSVQITNVSAVSPDSGATWSMLAGTLDTLTVQLTVDAVVLGTVVDITNYEGLLEVQTATPLGLTTGDMIMILGVEGNGSVSLANGVQTITVIDSTHFTLDGMAFEGQYISGGTIYTGPTTLVLNGSTNAATSSAFLAAISSQWPTVTASLGTGFYGPNTTLVLTGTTLGPTGSIVIGAGTANGDLGLSQNQAYYGTAGVNVGGQLPTALQLDSFSNAGNNGTFNVHTWIDSATVTVFNPAAVTPDAGTHAVFSTGYYNDILSGVLYGPAMSGSGATITSFATPLATVGGLTGMTPAIVRQSITFTGFGNSQNNGTFVVTGYISATSITIENTSAVSPDSGGAWSVPVGELDGATLIITVNSGSPQTLTLSGSTNAASMAAFFTAIEALWPTLVASPNPTQGSLVLTETSLFGPTSIIDFGGGTANDLLGVFGTWTGNYASASFAVSLAVGSPPLSGASVLSLTGLPVGDFLLCTQSAGPFRCQVENNTLTTIVSATAQFATANNPLIGPNQSLGVSSDGTTVNPDTPAPATPPAYVVKAYSQDISSGSVDFFPNPNVPFTATVSGNPSMYGAIVLDTDSTPFYSLVSNQSFQPATVSNNGQFFLPVLLGTGQTRLVVSDGSTGMWSIPTVTEDNGRVDRYQSYFARRASTAANLTSPFNYGSDLVWGTHAVGVPFTNGTPPPFVDGSFDTAQSDVNGAFDPTVYSANAGADIAVLGNILYMCGFSDGSANFCAFSISNGHLFAEGTVPTGSYLPNTLIAFKEASDPSEDIGGPTDCLFFVTASTVGTVGLNANNNSFSTNFTFAGFWPQARGILILGNDAETSVISNINYSSIGIWTDPVNGNIWAADVVNDQIVATAIYSDGNQPRAICQDRDTENFWVAFDGAGQIQYLNINMAVGQNLALTVISTLNYPGVNPIDDMLFDGAYLWVICVSENTYVQMTTNGLILQSHSIQIDSEELMTLTTDSRLYCDGNYVYITGIQRNGGESSAVIRLNPNSGLPVEYFNFPTFSTRGMAFNGNDVFIATAPTINNNVLTTNQGFGGTLATAIGGFADFQDTATPANWSPDVVGNWIYIQGASYSPNNGFFLITGWTSSTDITINNFSANISTETNNGSLQWQMYGETIGIQRLAAQPPGVDFGSLVSIIQTPAVAGWTSGLRLGARVVEYTGYSGPTTFDINVKPLAGTRVLFLDKDGNAAIHPLTISFSLSTVDGQSACSLQGPYAFLEIEWDGTTWLIIRQSNQVIGVGASRPANPLNGQGCFDFNIGLPIWWNGGQWINAAGTPV